MTLMPGKAIVAKGGVAPAGADSLLPADAVDFAAANLSSLVDYWRAKVTADPTKIFNSLMMNILSPGNATALLVADDANFDGLPTINIAPMTGASTVFVDTALCPASFTFIGSLRANALKNPQAFFGVSLTGYYATISGTGTITALAAQTGDTAWVDNHVVLPAATTSLIWISHDAVTKTTRVGKLPAVLSSHVHAVANAPGASSQARPFSYFSAAAGVNLNGNVEGFALLNKAYAADDTEEDNAIAALIGAWRTAIGASN